MSGIGKSEEETFPWDIPLAVNASMPHLADETDPDRPTTASASNTSEADSRMLAKLRAEIADLKDRLLRTSADLENARRRSERDVRATRQYAVADFAGDMLQVADNLRRALASVPAGAIEREAALASLIGGVELTEKELLRALEKHGIKNFHPLGERFDPHFHEAMFQVFEPSLRGGTITRVMQDGYSIGSRVLRPAKVAVSSRETQTSSLWDDSSGS